MDKKTFEEMLGLLNGERLCIIIDSFSCELCGYMDQQSGATKSIRVFTGKEQLDLYDSFVVVKGDYRGDSLDLGWDLGGVKRVFIPYSSIKILLEP